MISLFLDTHSSDLNIGVVKNNNLDEIKIKNLESHSNFFLSKVNQLLERNSIKPNEIDKIIVINGPGSFTGIRIAVTCAKVMAFMLKKDIIPISSLKAYAISASNYDYIIPVIDARRGYVYSAIYNSNLEEVLKESYISLEELMKNTTKLKGKIKFIGNLKKDDLNIIEPNLDIKKIIDYCSNLQPINPHLVNPNYLKKTEAEEKNDKNCK